MYAGPVCLYVCLYACIVLHSREGQNTSLGLTHVLFPFCFAWLHRQPSPFDRYWGQTIETWFAHTPHLFERSAMLDIETKMHAEVQVARRNRYRNARTDINIHLQVQHRTLNPLLF
jgi:hypothetical protein